MAVRIFSAALAMLAMLRQPFEPEHAVYLCAGSVVAALPGMFAAQLTKRNRAAWANWLTFGDMLPLALPLACICAWPELAVFAISHHLVRLFLGGWLLRSDGLRCEKNFTLILAYRQTLAHCHHFPGEVHPRENPLFQPARNAQNALAELLPLAGLLLGWLLSATGLRLGDCRIARSITAILSALLTVSLIRAHGRRLLPSRPPTLKCLLAVVLRAILLALGFELLLSIALSRLIPIAESDVPALCAMLPAVSLPDELRCGGANPQLCESVDAAVQWGCILWLVPAIIGIVNII